MNWSERITSDQSVLLGKPVVKGTWLSVDFLLGLLAADWSEEQVLKNYPLLKKDDLQALFAYAHECMRDGLMYELPKKTA